MDRAIGKNIRKGIEKTIASHKNKNICGFHMLRTRQSGSKMIIDFHLVFRKNIGLLEAHSVADHIEEDILKTHPDADVLIHLDPYNDGKAERSRKQ